MKNIAGLVRRFLRILFLSLILVVALNLLVLGMLMKKETAGGAPWTLAQETGDALAKSGEGYVLEESVLEELEEKNVWAVLIEDKSHEVVWHTDNLPGEIPLHYSLSDVASLTRGYVKDYPTYTGEREEGLVVLGYPKDRYWKHMYPSWDYDLIADLPKIILVVLAVNILLFFMIYTCANMKLMESIGPISEGIQKLPQGGPVYVRERGTLSEIARSINRTSELLEIQKRELKKKETARANWIAGVSHDIRTPLSVVMGYAGQLEESFGLTEEERRKLQVILKQSKKMSNLIGDLNLASKLEYNMQPASLKPENIVSAVRETVVEFINMPVEEKYRIEWETKETLTVCMACVDKALLKRAVSNLIWNCIHHNEDGCKIHVSVEDGEGGCVIAVEDDGAGVTKEQMKKIQETPHYMMCDTNTLEQQHGLGLLIVKQIVNVHQGNVEIGNSPWGGFSVKICLKKDDL